VGESFSYLIKTSTLWITVPLIVIVVGHLIGFVATSLIDKASASRRIFNISYSIVFLTLMATSSYFKYLAFEHEKHFGNIESNLYHYKSYMSFEEQNAFDSLSKLLGPNAFKITGGSKKEVDTVLANGAKERGVLCLVSV
jgi:hypothetical protein